MALYGIERLDSRLDHCLLAYDELLLLAHRVEEWCHILR